LRVLEALGRGDEAREGRLLDRAKQFYPSELATAAHWGRNPYKHLKVDPTNRCVWTRERVSMRTEVCCGVCPLLSLFGIKR
jgi:hypothetical protein